MTDMCLRIDGLPHDTWGYTLLPFQGVLYRPHFIPRVPLRSALGYEQVALSGRPLSLSP